jgi:hypothetical protein
VKNFAILAFGLALGLGAGLPPEISAEATPPARAASFSKDVLPILKSSCVKCHGGKETKAKLDLSSYAAAKKGGKSGPGFVEGDPNSSLLVTSISGDKPDMPKKAAPLSKAQVTLISTWIKEGAKNN